MKNKQNEKNNNKMRDNDQSILDLYIYMCVIQISNCCWENYYRRYDDHWWVQYYNDQEIRGLKKGMYLNLKWVDSAIIN